MIANQFPATGKHGVGTVVSSVLPGGRGDAVQETGDTTIDSSAAEVAHCSGKISATEKSAAVDCGASSGSPSGRSAAVRPDGADIYLARAEAVHSAHPFDPLSLIQRAKSYYIEQIMALIGRSSSNPKRYRELLEGFSIETLSRTWRELMDSTLPEISR